MADSNSKTLPVQPTIAPHAVLHVSQALRRHAILSARAERSSSLRDVVTAILVEWMSTIEHLRGAADRVDEYRTWADLATREYHALADQAEVFFNLIPVACLRTSDAGTILKANDAAAALFATSARRLVGRELAHHVEDRETFRRLLKTATGSADGAHAQLAVRPRERRPVMLTVTVRAFGDGEIVWVFDQAGREPAPAHTRVRVASPEADL